METETYLQARRLRSLDGLSVKEIAKRLDISLSSASTWVRDIELTRTHRRALPYGTVRMCIHSTAVVQSIFGAIQEYGGFERPEWLG